MDVPIDALIDTPVVVLQKAALSAWPEPVIIYSLHPEAQGSALIYCDFRFQTAAFTGNIFDLRPVLPQQTHYRIQ
jgi:hypothetical protein